MGKPDIHNPNNKMSLAANNANNKMSLVEKYPAAAARVATLISSEQKIAEIAFKNGQESNPVAVTPEQLAADRAAMMAQTMVNAGVAEAA